MGDKDPATQLLMVLKTREQILGCLQDGPHRKRDLDDQINVSRSTINRGVRDLESIRLITYGDDGYELTLYGVVALREYRAFHRRLRTLLRLEPFLKWQSPIEFDAPLDAFRDATVVTVEDGDPYAPVATHTTAIQNANQTQLALPVVGLQPLQAARDSVVQDGAQHEIIVDSVVADTLTSTPKYTSLVEQLSGTERVNLFYYEGRLPYLLGIFDDVIQLGATDTDDVPRALVETTDDRVGTWATEQYHRYKQQAQPFSTEIEQFA